MKSVRALGDTVVVEVIVQTEKKTDSGIILSANHDREAQSQATIISVGEKVEGIQVGDRVIISRLGIGELFELEGRYYRAMPKTEVFAVLVDV